MNNNMPQEVTCAQKEQTCVQNKKIKFAGCDRTPFS